MHDGSMYYYLHGYAGASMGHGDERPRAATAVGAGGGASEVVRTTSVAAGAANRKLVVKSDGRVFEQVKTLTLTLTLTLALTGWACLRAGQARDQEPEPEPRPLARV